jgi:hypothetical protein
VRFGVVVAVLKCGAACLARQLRKFEHSFEEHAQSWREWCVSKSWLCNPMDDQNMEDMMDEVGVVMAHAFEGVDRLGWTFSDIQCGLALVRASQSFQVARGFDFPVPLL